MVETVAVAETGVAVAAAPTRQYSLPQTGLFYCRLSMQVGVPDGRTAQHGALILLADI